MLAKDKAQASLLALNKVIADIKTEIARSNAEGRPQAELSKSLAKLISDYCKTIENPKEREVTKKALVASAKKWNWYLAYTYNILNNNLANSDYGQAKGSQLLGEVRRYLNDGKSFGVPIIADYQRKLQIALEALAADPPIAGDIRNGESYVVSLRNRAEMAVRFEANMEDLAALKAKGVRLVWTTSHPNCSPRCAKWQGRLYSLDGTYGVENGNRYEPIENAMRGVNNDGNGILSGFNCRHRVIAYIGQKAPQEYSEAEIKREYAVDRMQRTYETEIYKVKQQAAVMRASGGEKEADRLSAKAERLERIYRKKSLMNGRPIYPYRYTI